MGFGFLAIGYTVAYLMALFNGFGFAFLLLGYFLMWEGVSRLQEYCHPLRYAKWTLYPLLVVGAFRTVEGIFQLLDKKDDFFTTVSPVVDWAEFFLQAIFLVLLMLGIRKLATRVGQEKIKKGTIRNLIFFGVYFIMETVERLPMEGLVWYRTHFVFVIFLLNMVVILLNMVLLVTCYIRICPAGDEDMPRKPSRFKIINKLMEEMDKREARAYESAQKYSQERNGQKAEIANKHKKNKKKKKH